jgi:orotidine-5'-phosphate decarboxylase
MSSLNEKLIVALDVSDVAQARKMVARLGDSVSFYKIGMELAYGGGLALVDEFSKAGKQVFVDLKLHDIGHTVEKATAQIARLGARFLTVHAFPQTLAAARRGADGSQLQILGVTVMTSYDGSDLAACGYRLGLSELVALRATQAREAGIAGLILSPEELTAIRPLVGQDMLLVTPGIRPAGAALGDQKRVATPAQALARGADHIVVGRPILAAEDPRGAAEAIQREIAESAR